MDMAGQFLVIPFVDGEDGVEEFRDPPSVAADRRADRHAEEDRQLRGIEFVPLRLEFVVHVQGHDGLEVHVDELACQVEVPLDVGSVYDIDDDVRDRFDQVFPDIEFLRAVRGEGIGPRQVHEGVRNPL